MPDLDAWLEAFTNPLGIAGFSLFLVFLLITKFGKNKIPTPIKYIFVLMACSSLAFGLYISYQDAIKKSPSIISNVSGKDNKVNINIGNVGKGSKGEGKINIKVEGIPLNEDTKSNPKDK